MADRADTDAFSPVSNVHRKEVSGGITYGAVIHFTNHSVKPNVMKPWKAHDPVKGTGTGFLLGDRRIITNYHVIAFGASIRVERHGKPGNFEARLLCKSRLCDLALLTVDDEAFWTDDLPRVTLQDSVPELDDTVVAVGYPLGAKSVTVTRGVVSNVALADLTLTGVNPPQLQIQIDAAINPGNSGGPVFNVDSGKIVGVAFSAQTSAAGRGFIIPVPVLKLFLTTYEKMKHADWGLLPELGIFSDTLENAIMRKSCFGGEMPDHRDGCLITHVDKHSASYGKLQVGDILLEIAGNRVNEKCEVVYRGEEWLHWVYLITNKPVGDHVGVTVLRKMPDDSSETGKAVMQEVKVEIELAPLPKLVPRVMGVDYFPSYAIVGGLVIVPAGHPLQVANLEEFQGRVNPLYQTLDVLWRDGQLSDLEEQVCVLSSVLAHSCNVTYDRMVGKIVSKINGTEVKNMKHLTSLASKVEKGELVVDFKVPEDANLRCHVVFDAAEIKDCQNDILTLNKVSHWCSPQLLEENRWL